MTQRDTLTLKQQRFVEFYLIVANATQAAVQAGYSEHTAKAQGSRLLTNVAVAVAIESGRARLSESAGVTAERVIAEYARLAFVDMRSLYDDDGQWLPIQDLPEDVTRAISEVTYGPKGTTKLKLHSKQAALDSLARHLGVLKEPENAGGVTNIMNMIMLVQERRDG